MSAASTFKPAKVEFNFDVVCPYAYLASKRIEKLVSDSDSSAVLIWVPVLLGGLYKLDAAPQGKDGSASAVMPVPKKLHSGLDLQRQAARFHVPLHFHPQ